MSICFFVLSPPEVELRANLESISHRYHLFELALVRELTTETIHLPLHCLQGSFRGQKMRKYHLKTLKPLLLSILQVNSRATKPYALNPTPCTLTLHPEPYILHPKPTPLTLHPTPQPYTLNLTPHALTLHPEPYTLHPDPTP